MTEFIEHFEAQLPPELFNTFRHLNTPIEIQSYLDSMPYIAEERDRSPLNVMIDHQSHCLDGGLFAALALWRIGFKPLMIDLVPELGKDDDHVLAIYKIGGLWGAIAKSNYINLGYRDPVYRTLRELCMTYFEHFCSVIQTKTLRGYTHPIDASHYCYLNWAWDEKGSNKYFYHYFYGRKSVDLIPLEVVSRLSLVSDRVYKAETIYTDLTWSFGNRPEH